MLACSVSSSDLLPAIADHRKPRVGTTRRSRAPGLIDAGQPILHLAFGEAGLPVPEEVVEALTRGAPDNGYGPVAGWPGARAAVR